MSVDQSPFLLVHRRRHVGHLALPTIKLHYCIVFFLSPLSLTVGISLQVVTPYWMDKMAGLSFVPSCNIGAGTFTPTFVIPQTSPTCHRLSKTAIQKRHDSLSSVPSMIASERKQVSAPKIDWDNLGFQYSETACYVQSVWKNGQWSPLATTTEPYIRMHVAATALHYGQSCFEGLKAFRGADGIVRIFRPDENAKRMVKSADRLMIPRVPESLFLDAVHNAVAENIDFVPPYGTGGSLYIRPLLFGSGARIGLQPADEHTFLVLVVPVGDYYKGGLSPVTAMVMNDFDRAAPKGVGHVKVAGNYAADLMPNFMGKKAGYPINLYLDAANRRTVEEFGTSNFIGIKGNSYITPDSSSVLPSITNKTLMQLARDDGMTVEKRPIDIDEVWDMDEVAACGTAVVITAVTRLLYQNELKQIGSNPDQVGARLLSLYNRVRAIQMGEIDDKYGWGHPLRSQ